MPEEHNRRLTDHLSTLLLTHSPEAFENLAREGIAPSSIRYVGNTMIDTLLQSVGRARELAAWRDYGLEAGGYALVTLHRPALVDSPELLRATMRSLVRISGDLPVIFPVHPRTRARLDDLGIAPGSVRLVEPQPYLRFLSLEADAAAVITDSGGVQEETTVLGVPCFTLRENTERPITVSHGTNTVLGLDPNRILEIPARIATHRPTPTPPLWDGLAGGRAAAAVEQYLEAGGGLPAHANGPVQVSFGRVTAAPRPTE